MSSCIIAGCADLGAMFVLCCIVIVQGSRLKALILTGYCKPLAHYENFYLMPIINVVITVILQVAMTGTITGIARGVWEEDVHPHMRGLGGIMCMHSSHIRESEDMHPKRVWEEDVHPHI